MSLIESRSSVLQVPAGYVAIPISADQCAATLRLCAVAKVQPDPVAGHLVVLRDTLDARVFLGCIADAAGRIHQWIELRVQNLEGIAGAVAVCREALSNAALDERWARYCGAAEQIDQGGLVKTGWETVHPLPVFLDVAKLQPVHPFDKETGRQWRLCQDEALLAGAGLPGYGASLHRYLHIPELGSDSFFIPATFNAPEGKRTRPLGEAVAGVDKLVPLNPAGGLLLVQTHSPIGFEDFVGLLGGGAWSGLMHGRSLFEPPPAKAEGADEPERAQELRVQEGRIFLGRHGRRGRFVEALHLKLVLLSQAFSDVRSVVSLQRRPLLNVTPDSFRVKLGEPSANLPFLWTARAVLVDPGDAVALPLKTSDAQYYLRAGAATASIYNAASGGGGIGGRGSVRIRKVLPDTGDATVLEGTFVTQERVDVARHDLVWLRINLAGSRVDLFSHFEAAAALASGEWRFRTIGQRLATELESALRAAEGVPIPNVMFEVVPLLSTPCDLYALGVIAARTLLVDDHTTLPVALDEMMSLARQAALGHNASAGLGSRIKAVFESDARWRKSLGPQHLTNEAITPDDAFELVQADLWYDVLALIVRLFPGIGPDSECRDYGDAPAGGIHKVFDRAVAELDGLALRTRSLVVIDWTFNREINSVIRGCINEV